MHLRKTSDMDRNTGSSKDKTKNHLEAPQEGPTLIICT